MSEEQVSERVAFYLRHQKRIEEWLALKSEVGQEAHNFYCSLVEPLEQATEGLDGNPVLFSRLEGWGPPKSFLHRPEWGSGNAQGHPLMAIGIEWPSSSTTFSNSYSGVWINLEEVHKPITGNLFATLRPVISDVLNAKSPTMAWPSSSGWWPVWRYEEPPSGEYWRNLEVYSSNIVDAICHLWKILSAPIHDELMDALKAAEK